jgi:hypothetical protein
MSLHRIPLAEQKPSQLITALTASSEMRPWICTPVNIQAMEIHGGCLKSLYLCQFTGGYIHHTIWLRLPCQLRLWQDYARVSKIAAEEAAMSVPYAGGAHKLANLADITDSYKGNKM